MSKEKVRNMALRKYECAQARLAKTSCLQILPCDPLFHNPTLPLPLHLHREMPQPISTLRPVRQPPHPYILLQQLMRQPRRLEHRLINLRSNTDTSSLGALRRYFICRLSGKHTNVWQGSFSDHKTNHGGVLNPYPPSEYLAMLDMHAKPPTN